MARTLLHRFELSGHRYVLDPETCFCFECDEISWDVLEHYPGEPMNRIAHVLGEKHDPAEVFEVLGELEWLRATSSILKRDKPGEPPTAGMMPETGLKHCSVRLPEEAPAAARAAGRWFGRKEAPAASGAGPLAIVARAAQLLLNRASKQQDLRLDIIARGALPDTGALAAVCVEALQAAALAGKTLTVAVRVERSAYASLPGALEGHALALALELDKAEGVEEALAAFARVQGEAPAKAAKALPGKREGVRLRAIVTPGHNDFGGVVEALYNAGFTLIELDVDGFFLREPAPAPADMLTGLREAANYYAKQLLKHRYFRVDPLAELFWRIYDGAPKPRNDPAGLNELALDADGTIYPSRLLVGQPAYALGSLADGTLDEGARKAYDELGSAFQMPCRQCWARNLCGGGTAAVHLALNGSLRKPHAPWCEAQCTWLMDAVAAFNVLSSQGVHFTRVYQNLQPRGVPGPMGMLKAMRAAMQATLVPRPMEESDAPMLVRWENWSDAACFVMNEKGMLLAVQYDREMDSLHPLGLDQELVLSDRQGTPLGLLRMRPETAPGYARLWLYFNDEGLYSDAGIRKGFRMLLDHAMQAQSIQYVTAYAAAYETPLQAFWEGAGFTRAGSLREAVFLHGDYHDAAVFGYAAKTGAT